MAKSNDKNGSTALETQPKEAGKSVKVNEDGTIALEDRRSVQDILASGVSVRHFLKFKPGMQFTGAFVGEGDGVEFEKVDKVTGEMTQQTVRTVVFEVMPGLEIEVMASHQLEKRLLNPKQPVRHGTEVYVKHNGQTETRAGNRVNDIIIGMKRDMKPLIDATIEPKTE